MVQRVRFVYRKAYKRLVEDRSVCSDFRKSCWMVVKVWRVHLHRHKMCGMLVEVQRVSFPPHKACRWLVEVRRVGF